MTEIRPVPDATHDRGFTLLEVLVVVGIVALLAQVAMASYANYVARARAADLALADRVGVRDLPTLFLNGRPLTRELLTKDGLQARVRTELRRVDQLLAQGLARTDLYQGLVRSGRDGIAEPTLSELPPLPKGRYYATAGDSPVRGPAAAPITLILFADFQCPYCARFESTLVQLRARYGDKLRIVWKDAPDPEHSDALGAHEAARAAGEQGRFWPMHDKIVANPYLLNPMKVMKMVLDLMIHHFAYLKLNSL